MKIVRIVYTTRPEYAETNKANISAVMSELQKINHPGLNYNCCVGADGKTFTHTAFFVTDEDQKVLLELPVFKRFQEQLKASQPEKGPQQELLSLVGSSKNIFN